MKTVTLLTTASNALQSTNPHTLFTASPWEENVVLSVGLRKDGILLWIDTSEGATFYTEDDTTPISRFVHTAKVYVVKLVGEVDTATADIDPTDLLDAFLLAFVAQVRALENGIAGQTTTSGITIAQGLTDENVGGITTTINFTTNYIC